SDVRLSSNTAVATARAGGIGIVDCMFADDSSQVVQHIASLHSLDNGRVGLKVHVDQADVLKLWLDALVTEGCIVVLTWHGATLKELQLAMLQIAALKPKADIWVEIHAATALKDISSLDGIAAIVAKGHESGGWVGEDAAFILSQKVVTATSLPVFIQGGVGVHTAAACRAIGAAGVVLEEQLFLMPESGLAHKRPVFEGLNGKECVAIGEHFGAPCRILDLPRLQQAQAFKALRDEIDMNCDALSDAKETWLSQANAHLNWLGKDVVFPMGQGIGLAAKYTDTYKTTGRLVQAILQASISHLKIAKQHSIMHKDAPLAHAHGTQYPFVQGPMTRVSDTPEFAKAVADAGGLPLLALAVLKAEQIDGILAASETVLQGQSWGVGLLCFIEQSVYEAQLVCVLQHKPPFALIAGGR
ncbi:MAG: 6-deoxyerythronolide-B synthase, partial [Ghiorsea sp.]